jgi:hypothetical protein
MSNRIVPTTNEINLLKRLVKLFDEQSEQSHSMTWGNEHWYNKLFGLIDEARDELERYETKVVEELEKLESGTAVDDLNHIIRPVVDMLRRFGFDAHVDNVVNIGAVGKPVAEIRINPPDDLPRHDPVAVVAYAPAMRATLRLPPARPCARRVGMIRCRFEVINAHRYSFYTS